MSLVYFISLTDSKTLVNHQDFIDLDTDNNPSPHTLMSTSA